MTTRCGRVLACVCLLLGFAGCARDSAEAIIIEQTAAFEEVTAVLESIRDEASAEAALPQLKKACDRLRRANDRGRATHNLTPGETMPSQARINGVIQASIRMLGAELKAHRLAPNHAKQIRDLVEYACPDKEPGR